MLRVGMTTADVVSDVPLTPCVPLKPFHPRALLLIVELKLCLRHRLSAIGRLLGIG